MKFRSRIIRFSLFKLLLLLTAACVCFAVYGQIRSRSLGQRDALRVITSSAELPLRRNNPWERPWDRKKAVAIYDYQIEAHNTIQAGMFSAQPSPHWLANWLGVDFVHNVEMVDFDVSADAELISQLKKLPGLKQVIVNSGLANQSAWNELVECTQLEKLVYVVYWHDEIPIKFQNLANLTRLTELQVHAGSLDQDQLMEISRAKSINTLRLIDVHIQREDLLGFPVMEQLESFFWKIYLNPLDDDEFRFLKKMPNLKHLAMAGHYELTDQAFRTIQDLDQLVEISLHGTNFTGSELHRLQHLPNLVKLELGASQLSDDALLEISRLHQLKHLEVGSTDVTDDGMQHVAKLSNLTHLSIRDTVVSDVGLQRLEVLSNLKFLRIRDTQITAAGIAAFQRTQPDCLVELR